MIAKNFFLCFKIIVEVIYLIGEKDMKINLIQRDIALSGFHSESKKFREKSGMSVCEKNRGYSAEFSGSFTGKSETAANVLNKSKSFSDKVLTSKWFDSLTTAAEKHNVATSALIALGLAGVMRPATTMALPGKKDKDDKIYASGHAMASGVMGFIVSLILTSPLDDAFTKCFEASEKLANIEYLKSGKTIKDKEVLRQTEELMQKPEELKQIEKRAAQPLKEMFVKMHELNELSKQELKQMKKNLKFYELKKGAMTTLMKTMPDWVIAVPRATLTIALIPPILKYVFGLEKKKKAQIVQEETVAKDIITMNVIDKPIFAAFKGGVR